MLLDRSQEFVSEEDRYQVPADTGQCSVSDSHSRTIAPIQHPMCGGLSHSWSSKHRT
jgi:hypothetical protein